MGRGVEGESRVEREAKAAQNKRVNSGLVPCTVRSAPSGDNQLLIFIFKF